MNKPHAAANHNHRPPYPPPPPHRKSGGGGTTNCASCILAALFLVFIIIIAAIVYFSLLKPHDPQIAVNAVQVPSFTVKNNTVTFTISEYVSVKNPNRAVFSQYDSTLQILYGGSQVGFMYIPAGKVAAGRTEYMAATFSVMSIPISAVPDTVGQVIPKVGDGIDRVSPVFEIESRMEVAGWMRILHFFTHHVAVTADCRIAIGVSDGSVLGYHC